MISYCNKGYFITVEGSEGSGKTTSLSFIKSWLADHHIDFIATREPGGTIFSEQLRQMLLHPTHGESIDDTAELLLMFAARSQHIQQVILPALRNGKVVVCDRFTDTTWAYQGGGRGMNKAWISQLETMVQGDLLPNMTLLFDVPVLVGLNRAELRSNPDRFEKEKIDFFERVREVYLERAKAFRSQYKVVDATQSVEKVNDCLSRILKEKLITDKIH